MNGLTIQEIKDLFSQHEIEPKKYLGQNFLVEKNSIHRVILAANLRSDQTILEIGPGLGALTQEIAPLVKKLIVVEKDPVLLNILKDRLQEYSNISYISADILETDLSDLMEGPYFVISNLPYAITGPIIRKFLEHSPRPDQMILMMQKEVAQRIIAKPPRMNLLAASVQFYATAKLIGHISKNSFWPRPRVESSVLNITPHSNYTSQIGNIDTFFKVVKAGFSQPRKQLVNNLSVSFKSSKEDVSSLLTSIGIKPTQRAQTLSLEAWISLAKKIEPLK